MSWTAPPTFVAGTVFTAANANILSNDLSFLAGTTSGLIATSETGGTTSYTDLPTPGPTVSVTTGARALVVLAADLANSGANDHTFMSFAVSGATTIAASDANGMYYEAYSSGAADRHGITIPLTGLTAGVNVFTAKYKVDAGTGTWSNRAVAVVPLS